VGRKDQQIKIRGFRVELGEIESTLMALPGVAQAAVVALAGEDGDKRLRAHLVFEKNTIAQMERIKERITETLPDYMRPSEFVVEDSLPLTPSGKVDRNALMQTTLSSVQITSSPTAPRNDLEWRIQLIWQSVLGRKDIGIHDNFFELGGHSFLAMSLLTKMEELVRRRLPLAWLFECPTIASLVGRFREDQNRQGYLSLVTLQPEGSGTPVYFVHGWGGDLFWWMDLAREMGPDRPVFGLRAVGLDDESPRHTSMEELVAHYASEIQQHHPKGPCHILGYSLGAWNAHALACELKRRGMQIGLLGLLDAEVLEANWNFQERIYHHGDDFKRNLDDFKKSLWKQAPRFKRWLTPKGFLQAAAKAQKSVATSKAPNEPLAPGSIDYTRDDYYKRIASRYRALQYEGDAVVFISEENTPERLKGWRRFIKGTVVYESVPGTHLQMLKPGYVETLATTLRRCLVQAESGKG
jgi:thioesterase domain-containing protein